VRRGLRIRFNWDYISIKTASPLERENIATRISEGTGNRTAAGEEEEEKEVEEDEGEREEQTHATGRVKAKEGAGKEEERERWGE